MEVETERAMVAGSKTVWPSHARQILTRIDDMPMVEPGLSRVAVSSRAIDDLIYQFLNQTGKEDSS